MHFCHLNDVFLVNYANFEHKNDATLRNIREFLAIVPVVP